MEKICEILVLVHTGIVWLKSWEKVQNNLKQISLNEIKPWSVFLTNKKKTKKWIENMNERERSSGGGG